MARVRCGPVSECSSRPPRESEGKRLVSWFDIERAILLRIARKEYLAGQRIPTCEALAAEFGANKNTVSRAYRSLAERGYLLTRAGFGTFIANRPVRMSVDSALDGIHGLLSLAVQEAKLSGLRQEQFREFVDDVVAHGYNLAEPRIGFVDCSRHDATTLSRDLQNALRHPIEPLLIDDVIADPERFLTNYSVLAVSLVHLSALEVGLGKRAGSGGRAQVFGMYIPVSRDSLTQVARFRAGTKVGIVCDLEQTLVGLKGTIGGLNPSISVEGCISKDKAGIKRLFKISDLLLVTLSASARVKFADSQTPVITLGFRHSEESVRQLSELISQHMPSAVKLSETSSHRRRATPER
jgi:DNA-binding transcriptional regulator YhcF (GntR family)